MVTHMCTQLPKKTHGCFCSCLASSLRVLFFFRFIFFICFVDTACTISCTRGKIVWNLSRGLVHDSNLRLLNLHHGKGLRVRPVEHSTRGRRHLLTFARLLLLLRLVNRAVHEQERQAVRLAHHAELVHPLCLARRHLIRQLGNQVCNTLRRVIKARLSISQNCGDFLRHGGFPLVCVVAGKGRLHQVHEGLQTVPVARVLRAVLLTLCTGPGVTEDVRVLQHAAQKHKSLLQHAGDLQGHERHLRDLDNLTRVVHGWEDGSRVVTLHLPVALELLKCLPGKRPRLVQLLHVLDTHDAHVLSVPQHLADLSVGEQLQLKAQVEEEGHTRQHKVEHHARQHDGPLRHLVGHSLVQDEPAVEHVLVHLPRRALQPPPVDEEVRNLPPQPGPVVQQRVQVVEDALLERLEELLQLHLVRPVSLDGRALVETPLLDDGHGGQVRHGERVGQEGGVQGGTQVLSEVLHDHVRQLVLLQDQVLLVEQQHKPRARHQVRLRLAGGEGLCVVNEGGEARALLLHPAELLVLLCQRLEQRQRLRQVGQYGRVRHRRRQPRARFAEHHALQERVVLRVLRRGRRGRRRRAGGPHRGRLLGEQLGLADRLHLLAPLRKRLLGLLQLAGGEVGGQAQVEDAELDVEDDLLPHRLLLGGEGCAALLLQALLACFAVRAERLLERRRRLAGRDELAVVHAVRESHELLLLGHVADEDEVVSGVDADAQGLHVAAQDRVLGHKLAPVEVDAQKHVAGEELPGEVRGLRLEQEAHQGTHLRLGRVALHVARLEDLLAGSPVLVADAAVHLGVHHLDGVHDVLQLEAVDAHYPLGRQPVGEVLVPLGDILPRFVNVLRIAGSHLWTCPSQ
eukprot:Rhum_TRINITY_DN2254_c0_g1::Rhum_TRINITY_DN2254_c0_g1_i1::g.6529::m.6529